VSVLDMIDILPPLGKYKYDTWRILPVKCYIGNSMCLWICIRNVNSLRILNQPIDRPLKVSDLGQIDPFHLCGLHLVFQHQRVVCGNRYGVGMLEGIHDHLPCSIVEHEASLTPSAKRKCSCMQKRIKFACQSKFFLKLIY
jgi:hypothetical protein